MSRNHDIVRLVANGKDFCIVLFTFDQINDIKRFCCTGKTPFGVDKTFNLGLFIFLQTSSYCNVCVVGLSNNYGSFFLHGSSTLSSFTSFLSSVAAALQDNGATIENLTIGSDDETSNRIAIKLFLPQSHNVLCTRHLRENVAAYLKNKVGLKPSSK